MKRFMWSLAAAVAMAAPSFSFAQAVAETSKENAKRGATTEEAAVDPNTGALTLTGGIDYTTAYFFRGYAQEDTGLILQPYVTITASLVSTDDFTLNAYVGTWNSFHEKKTLADGNGNSGWYESDLFGGIDLILGKFTVGTIYTFYTYPGGAFETIGELGFKVAYDDTDCMKKMGVPFTLKPYAGVYFEVDDGNGEEDTYAEVGLSPSFPIGDTGVTISVPMTLGLSLDGYYLDSDGTNDTLGYGSVGLFGSIPLPMGDKYGAWTLTGGVQYIYLFADNLEASNDGGKNDEILGKVGVSFAY